MRIIFDTCMVVKAFPSERQPKRVYVDVVDLSDGRAFSFSDDTLGYPEWVKLVQQIGALEARFETYMYNDQKTGQSRLQFKAFDPRFVPVNGKK